MEFTPGSELDVFANALEAMTVDLLRCSILSLFTARSDDTDVSLLLILDAFVATSSSSSSFELISSSRSG